MAKCRIQNLKPPCDYGLAGLTSIQLLDREDFAGFRFDGDDLYSNCLVTALYRSADLVDVAAPDNGARYTSSLQNKIYTHTLETFIADLSAPVIADAHLSTKRRYVPVFGLPTGKFFTFGYDAGARVSFSGQTSDAIGVLLTITANSIYPLFEVAADALAVEYGIEFVPDFGGSAYCEIK